MAGGPRVRTAPLPPWPHYDDDEIDAVDAGPAIRQGQLLDRRRVPRVRATSSPPTTASRTRSPWPTARSRSSSPCGSSGSAPATRSSSRRAPSSPRRAASCCAGATPVFADVDRDSRNITAESIAAVLTDRARRRSSSSTSPAGRATCRDHGARPRARPEGHRGLRPGARRARSTGSSSARSATSAHSRSARTRSSRPAARAACCSTNDRDLWSRRLVVQGPRQELGRGLRRRPSARLPLAARELRHQLADDRDAGGDRPDAAGRSWTVGWRRVAITPPA